MARQNIDGGGWFNPNSAQKWEEDTRWDGNNHVSLATGTQWDHEWLYRTRSGAYVLHWWSQWQGSRERWERISDEQAHAWLIAQGEADSVPESVLAAAEV